MIHWSGLMPWMCRAWPIFGLVPVGVTHACAFLILGDQTALVNKAAGMSLQIFGGLLVLYSINDNLGLFREQTLVSTITAWLKAFPIKRKSITLFARGAASAKGSATISMLVRRAAKTTEERIAALEERAAQLEVKLLSEINSVNSRIDTVRKDLQEKVAETSGRVTTLSNRLEHAAVGGFKMQAFGVLLAIYGAVTSVFA